MDTKSALISKATELLAASKTGDISTRAVCDAVGVGQPVLYRIFGDKDGLMAAVVDEAWSAYIASKRRAEASNDPVEDLRHGWDNHTAFALANPHAYRLLFATPLTTRPSSLDQAMELLLGILRRVAEQGRLRVSPEEAARIVMAANSGIALGLILRPEQYSGMNASDEVRDATLRSILAETTTLEADAPSVAATTLQAHLADTDAFTPAEAALLTEWLTRLQ